jgi:hypothetical protein
MPWRLRPRLSQPFLLEATQQHRAIGASKRGIGTRRHTAAADHGKFLAVSAAPLDLQHAPCLAQDHCPGNRQQASQHAADDAAD